MGAESGNEAFGEAHNINEDEVLDAVHRNDWQCLRKLSLKPEGFGEKRIQVWPFLLHVQHPDFEQPERSTVRSNLRRRKRSNDRKESEEGEKGRSLSASVEEHPDERQIKLDTDRSFVLYSVDTEGRTDREELQAELNELLTSIFRRHPQLSYFQGYHDIITVLFLTLPESDRLACAEKMSLHRLRDAMGKGLEPLIGLLRILKFLLRLADPEYSALLERSTPLPYFALSNLLTLFAHDVPTLPLIQHVFDFLLCRPPIASLYLAAAITLARKEEAEQMEEDGEEGMLHSLLSSLPEFVDEVEIPEDGHHVDENVLPGDLLGKKTVEEVALREEKSGGDLSDEKDEEMLTETETSECPVDGTELSVNNVAGLQGVQGKEPRTDTDSEAWPSLTDELSSLELSPSPGISQAPSPLDADHTDGSSPSRPTSPLSLSSPFRRTRRAPVPLSTILTHADELLAQYPPSHPALQVNAIMGPQSVLFTWSADAHEMASDAEAEGMVAHPELVVREFVDPDEVPDTKEGDGTEDDGEGYRGSGQKSGRKLRKRRRATHFGVSLNRKTVLTGAFVALGVAAAVYSIRSKNGHNGMFDVHRAGKQWRKAGRWISGTIVGGGERLLDTLGL